MIKSITIYNRFHMDMFVSTGGLNLPHKRWYLVSIYGDDAPYVDKNIAALKNMGCVGTCSLLFWDITSEIFDKIKDEFPEAVLFNKTHAKKIISFLDKAQKDTEDGDLVIHCSAGVSRSGAVGTFACDYFGFNYDEFIKKNPYVMANPYVLNLLRRCSGMTPSFSDHDGIDHKHEKESKIAL